MSSLKKSWQKGISKALLSCDKATFLVTKQSVSSINCVERVQLHMHLAICVFCRNFKEQSEFLNQQIQHWAQPDPDHLVLQLSDDQKDRMKEYLRNAGA